MTTLNKKNDFPHSISGLSLIHMKTISAALRCLFLSKSILIKYTQCFVLYHPADIRQLFSTLYLCRMADGKIIEIQQTIHREWHGIRRLTSIIPSEWEGMYCMNFSRWYTVILLGNGSVLKTDVACCSVYVGSSAIRDSNMTYKFRMIRTNQFATCDNNNNTFKAGGIKVFVETIFSHLFNNNKKRGE